MGAVLKSSRSRPNKKLNIKSAAKAERIAAKKCIEETPLVSNNGSILVMWMGYPPIVNAPWSGVTQMRIQGLDGRYTNAP
jgi:hypothetical protein